MSQVSRNKRRAKRDELRANGQLVQKPVPPPEPPQLDENGNVILPPKKPYPQPNEMRLSVYLQQRAKRKHAKQHLRQDKREAKEQNKYKMKKLARLAAKGTKSFKNKNQEAHVH